MNKQTEMTLPKLWDDLSLRPYLGEIRRRHGIVETLALPSMRDIPPVRIETLFVSPLLAQSQVSSDSDPGQWPKGQSLFEALQESLQLVVLGDPGGGKTTLSNWLAWRLSAGLTTHLPESLDNRVPVPCILRDMPSSIFTPEYSISDLVVGIAERILGDTANDAMKSSLRNRVDTGSYVLILDGVDEISIEHRKIVSGWIQKANSQNAPVLATSRIVGYEDWPVDRVQLDLQKRAKQQNPHLVLSTLLGDANVIEKVSSIIEGLDEPVPAPILASVGRPLRWAQIRYLMPFDQNRISAFAENWYRQRCGSEQEARQKAGDLLASLGRSEVTRQLARTPNLLSMMAIVHRERAHLPDGKALLYDEIANAYINTIDKQRKILPGDALAPYEWKERKAWLAYVGFNMQQLRNNNDDNKSEKRILASEENVLKWLAEAMENSGVTRPEETAKLFLSWVARRSGLLLPRGDRLYAFVHLSFQEYFCACYLSSRIVRPSFIRDGNNPEKEKLPTWCGMASWRETLVYLFELLSAERDSDWVEILADALFGSKKAQLVGNTAALAGRLMNDKHIRLGVEWKDTLADRCSLQAWNDWFVYRLDYAGMSVFPALLEAGYAIIVVPPEGGKDLDTQLPVRALKNLDALSEEKKLRVCIVLNEETADLSPLAKLTDLQGLHIANTQVTDLSPLAGITGLLWLHINNTQVADLAPLAGLTELLLLQLNDTQVTSLSPIAGLTKLVWLQLNDTQVSNLSLIVGLTELGWLQLNDTMISDLSPIAGFTELKKLSLNSTGVSDLSPLAGLTSLESLYLGSTQVSDISSLAGLTSLQELRLENTQVSDLSPLKGLTALQELYLENSQVSDLLPLAGLTSLRELRLENTQVSDLSPLKGLTSLQLLFLSNTQVSDLSPLKGLTDLQFLYFNNTRVTDTSPLAHLKNLRIST